MDGLQQRCKIVPQRSEWPPQRFGPRDQNIVMAGLPIKGKQACGSGAQAAFHAVSFHGAPDLPGGGEADPEGLSFCVFFQGRGGFESQPRGHPARGTCAPQEIRPVFQPAHF